MKIGCEVKKEKYRKNAVHIFNAKKLKILLFGHRQKEKLVDRKNRNRKRRKK
jgi:hypothetical protein